MPNTPESVPRSLEIARTSKEIKPIKSKIARIVDSMFTKNRHAFFKSSFVFAQKKAATPILLLRIKLS